MIATKIPFCSSRDTSLKIMLDSTIELLDQEQQTLRRMTAMALTFVSVLQCFKRSAETGIAEERFSGLDKYLLNLLLEITASIIPLITHGNEFNGDINVLNSATQVKTVAASSEWPIIANMEKVKRENNVGVVAQK
jgi:hypothetical protein